MVLGMSSSNPAGRRFELIAMARLSQAASRSVARSTSAGPQRLALAVAITSPAWRRMRGNRRRRRMAPRSVGSGGLAETPSDGHQ